MDPITVEDDRPVQEEATRALRAVPPLQLAGADDDTEEPHIVRGID